MDIISHNDLKNILKQRPKKKSKYKNKKITVDNVTYDSKSEYARECVLRQQEKAGIIKNVKRQVSFNINSNGYHICKYKADWTYTVVKNDKTVIEDFKGFETPIFKLKRKMMLAINGLSIFVNKNINAIYDGD